MLLRTLFVLLLLGALGETIVHGAHALAQAVLRGQALVAVHDQLTAATTAAEQTVAAAIELNGTTGTLVLVAPSPSPTCVLATQNGCAMQGQATITFETAVLTATPSPCPSAACTVYVQGNDSVEEGRIGATIGAQVIGADGAVLASRSEQVTFRTMLVAPYVALDGEGDDSLPAIAAFGNGNDAGAAPNGDAPGTLIDVLYENQTTGATMPANVWRSQVQNPGTTPLSWAP